MLVPLIIEPDVDDADCATLCVDGEVTGLAARFVLDTGAARSQAVVDGCSPELTRAARSTGVFGPEGSAKMVVPELRVGTAVAANLDVDVIALSHPRPRNLLGMDFLGPHTLTVDFDKHLVGIDEHPPAGHDWRDLRVGSHGHPHVEVRWPKITGWAVWDTGAGTSIVSEHFFAAHRSLFTPAGLTTGTDANGRQRQTPTYLAAPCEIGGLRFRPHRTAVIDLARIGAGDIDLILGYTSICQANWYIDLPRRRWTAWPRA